MQETMSGKIEELGRTVSEWKGGIKENIICQKEWSRLKEIQGRKKKIYGWWNKKVAKAIGERKRANQRNLFKVAKRFRNRYDNEWTVAWYKYKEVKKAAQVLIRRKIGKWEEEQAKILNDMSQREREKEAWIWLRWDRSTSGCKVECRWQGGK